MYFNILEKLITKSKDIAKKYSNKNVSCEHLLLALTEESKIMEFFFVNNISIDQFTKNIEKYFLCNNLADRPKKSFSVNSFFNSVMCRSMDYVGCGIVPEKSIALYIMFECFSPEENPYLSDFFMKYGISQDIIWVFLRKNIDCEQLLRVNEVLLNTPDNHNFTILKKNEVYNSDICEVKKFISDSKNYDFKKEDILSFCVNLNEKASNKEIDSVIGRKSEMSRITEILSRRKKSNVILVGDTGVGKTAIVEGLAKLIVDKLAPRALMNSVVYSLDIAGLVSGTKYRGDFESKIKSMILFIESKNNAILFIDEIHTVIGTGSNNFTALDLANILKPILTRGSIKCIGSTTFKEYRNIFEKDAALTRRFQKVIIQEPNFQSSINILYGLKPFYEEYHNVIYDRSSIISAINLSSRYMHNRCLPDKAIDLIDEAGAIARIKNDEDRQSVRITDSDIGDLIAKHIGIPDKSILDDKICLRKLDKELKKYVFGQDQAIEDLCKNIKLQKLGLSDYDNKFTNCYLFVGKSGVGKTELISRLAEFCNMKIIKFSMSEFSEEHSITKLIGSSPGYVAFEQGGLLIEQVSQDPYSVVVFDNIEKAHFTVLELLSRIVENNNIRDNLGKIVSFANNIVIFTTSLGSKNIGFNKNNGKTHVEILDSRFDKNFIHKLDKVIVFNSVENILDKILDRKLEKLKQNLLLKDVVLEIDKKVEKYLLKRCSNNSYKLIDKIIKSEIIYLIMDDIIFGELKEGGVITLKLSKEEKIISNIKTKKNGITKVKNFNNSKIQVIK
ncbi:AAA family ATPase [Rickettsia endosymbiont of Cardiosporidium cionae]|uniref:AAA family ATPase n=1 Tax=Rickettsia endosymbiont of Cardiosporidium cionae TaxID=2777155 RepID=UPI001893A122|nr:ATP-dependent Clp protease ATP-binding subunit [Rickettsia endosymbiont of Cardiosporidium cionae]KAF8818345.1 hypothetical protein IHI24_000807 [Rickettsia endosymbiont of Cardiosporidium cionae]